MSPKLDEQWRVFFNTVDEDQQLEDWTFLN